MPILFQYRNIKHLLAMHITKQAEQEIYLIAQKKVTMVPPPPQIHMQHPKLAVVALSKVARRT